MGDELGGGFLGLALFEASLNTNFLRLSRRSVYHNIFSRCGKRIDNFLEYTKCNWIKFNIIKIFFLCGIYNISYNLYLCIHTVIDEKKKRKKKIE